MLFLSAGSNYTFKQALGHCFARGRSEDSAKLQKALVDRYAGQKALLFARGRDALAAAVRTATGGSGAVIVTSLTCYSVIDAVKVAGCEVVYADISSETLQFDAATLRAALADVEAKAVIVQNTLGIPSDIDEIIEVAREHGLVVIEDIAHAAGGRYSDGREIGTVGDMTMLSFGRDKFLDTVSGGALVIRTERVPSTLRPPVEFPGRMWQFRDRIYPLIGWTARVVSPIGLGGIVNRLSYILRLANRSADAPANPDMRLPHWQAKRAHMQVENMSATVEQRRARQAKYLEALAHLSPRSSSNAVRLPLLVENTHEVIMALRRAGFFTKDRWYEVPVSPERLYAQVGFDEAAHPVVTEVAKHVINLPTHQFVRDDDIAKMIEIVRKEARPWSM